MRYFFVLFFLSTLLFAQNKKPGKTLETTIASLLKENQQEKLQHLLIHQPQTLPLLVKHTTNLNPKISQRAIANIRHIKKVHPKAIIATIDLLKHPTIRIQAFAASALKKIAPMADLIKVLETTKNNKLQSSLIRLLEDLGAKATVASPALLRLLKNSTQEHIKEKIIIALGKLPSSKEIVNTLVYILKNEKIQLQVNAVISLGELKVESPKIISLLTSKLLHKNRAMRDSAIYALVKIGEKAVPVLEKRLEQGTYFCIYSCNVLGKMGKKARSASLSIARHLSSPSPQVRANAAWAIGKIGAFNKDIVQSLILLVHDQKSYVKKEAILALQKIPQKFTSLIIKALDNSKTQTRGYFIRILGHLPMQETLLAKILEQLHSPFWIDRHAACVAIKTSKTKTKKVIVALIACVKREISKPHKKSSFIISVASQALIEMRAIVVKELIPLLDEKDFHVRLFAILTLEKMQTNARDAIPYLILHLKDPHIEIRRNCILALASMKMVAAPAAVPLLELLKDKEPKVRLAAIFALGKILPMAHEIIVPSLKEALKQEKHLKVHAFIKQTLKRQKK